MERGRKPPRFLGMPTANINDRASIERVYPADAFARDAAENDRPKVEVLHGVRIASAPDEAGEFALDHATQHAGEAPGAIFLAPFHRAPPAGGAGTRLDPRAGYKAFLDEIIENALRHGYHGETSPGPGDPRIRGARQ